MELSGLQPLLGAEVVVFLHLCPLQHSVIACYDLVFLSCFLFTYREFGNSPFSVFTKPSKANRCTGMGVSSVRI